MCQSIYTACSVTAGDFHIRRLAPWLQLFRSLDCDPKRTKSSNSLSTKSLDSNEESIMLKTKLVLFNLLLAPSGHYGQARACAASRPTVWWHRNLP